MKKAFAICMLISLSLLIDCNSENKKDTKIKKTGTINISGAFALYPLVVKWKEEYNKIYPDVQIDVSAGGAGKGMADVLAGLVDIGMVSREISKNELNKGTWYLPVAKDAVVCVVNSLNPVIKEIKKNGISVGSLNKIFVDNQIKSWGEAIGNSLQNRELIQVYTRSDACGSAGTWASLFGNKQEDLDGIGVFGDPGIAQAVKKDRLAISYSNIAFAYNPKTLKAIDGIEIVPIKFNVLPISDFYSNMNLLLNAVDSGLYPSPPSRSLYLVTKNKPENPLLLHFLGWILKDGQKYVKESGFIQLKDTKLKECIEKLDSRVRK